MPVAASAHRRLGGGCDLSGDWSGSLGGGPIGPSNIHLDQDLTTGVIHVTGAVSTTAQYFVSNASIVFNAFPGYPYPLVGLVGSFNGSVDSCSELAWQAPYSPPNSFWCLSPICLPPVQPPANWANEVNFCAGGFEPPAHVDNMFINPCSQNDVSGTNFSVPAQQFSVSTLSNHSGGEGPPAILYFGERFRSSPSGNKSADFQCMCCEEVMMRVFCVTLERFFFCRYRPARV